VLSQGSGDQPATPPLLHLGRGEVAASMIERRQFVSNFLAAAISSCALSTVPTKSVSLEDTVKSRLEGEFSNAIRGVASVRQTNRSTGLDVTHQFSKITEMYSLPDFQTYVALRYGLTRVKTGVGNEEFTYLDDKILKAFDKRFLTFDRLTVGFRYNSDWKDIVEFRATLVNLGE
jgi:hypothetical protein